MISIVWVSHVSVRVLTWTVVGAESVALTGLRLLVCLRVATATLLATSAASAATIKMVFFMFCDPSICGCTK